MTSTEKDQAPDHVDRLLSISEAAGRLGISTFFLYRLVEAGKIPSVKIQRRRLLRESDIRRLVQKGMP